MKMFAGRVVYVFLCVGLLQGCYGGIAEDIETIRNHIYDYLMPDYNDNALTLMAEYMPNFDSATGAFTDITYGDNYHERSDPFKMHADRVYAMARAYFLLRSGNTYYQDSTHAQNIEKALYFIAYTAPENNDPSWWNKKIEVTTKLTRPMIMARSFIDHNILQKLFDRYWNGVDEWDLNDHTENMAGGNFAVRAKVGLWGALAVSDELFQQMYNEVIQILHKELILKDGYNGAGMQPDYCLHQHNFIDEGKTIHQEYNGCYTGLLSDIASIASILKDTSFAIDLDMLRNLVDGLLECHQWFVWNRASEPSVSGRKLAMNKATTFFAAEKTKRIAVQMLEFGYRVNELQKIINRHGMWRPNIGDALIGNRALFSSAMMIHRRPCYMVGLRMLSDRVLRPESWASIGIHNTNLNSMGYYEGDGWTTFIQNGHELGEMTKEIYKFYDYEKIPGTTVQQIGTIPALSTGRSNMIHALNVDSFVGGVSDNYYGASAMKFNRAPLPFTAKKMWAFFDDETVAIGCDIKPKDGEPLEGPLYTTLNQVKRFGDVHIKDAAGNVQVLSAAGSVDLSQPPKWILHDDVAYIPIVSINVPTPSCTVGIEERTYGSSSSSLFQAYFDHGMPTVSAPASYGYIVKMVTTLDEVDDYANNIASAVVVTNTPQVQAVVHIETRVGYAIFYEPTSVNTEFLDLAVDEPCMVLYRETDSDGIKIAVSNPGSPGLTVTVDVGRVLEGPDTTQNGGRTSVVFQFPDDDALTGKSIVKNFTAGDAATEPLEAEENPDDTQTSTGGKSKRGY